MFRFTIRDVLWLTLVAAVATALGTGWWRDRQRIAELEREMQLVELFSAPQIGIPTR